MDVNALLGAPTGSAARAVNQLVNTPAATPASAPGAGNAAQGVVPVPAPQLVDAPSVSPAVEEADLQNLPLAIRYAPSSPPTDALRAANFDRLA